MTRSKTVVRWMWFYEQWPCDGPDTLGDDTFPTRQTCMIACVGARGKPIRVRITPITPKRRRTKK